MVYLVCSVSPLSKEEKLVLDNISKFLGTETTLVNIGVVPLPKNDSLHNIAVAFGQRAATTCSGQFRINKIIKVPELNKLIPLEKNNKEREASFELLSSLKEYILVTKELSTDLTTRQLIKLSKVIEELQPSVSILDNNGEVKVLDIISITEVILTKILKETLNVQEVEIEWQKKK